MGGDSGLGLSQASFGCLFELLSLPATALCLHFLLTSEVNSQEECECHAVDDNL